MEGNLVVSYIAHQSIFVKTPHMETETASDTRVTSLKKLDYC